MVTMRGLTFLGLTFGIISEYFFTSFAFAIGHMVAVETSKKTAVMIFAIISTTVSSRYGRLSVHGVDV